MFSRHYFAPHYFAPHYWASKGSINIVSYGTIPCFTSLYIEKSAVREDWLFLNPITTDGAVEQVEASLAISKPEAATSFYGISASDSFASKDMSTKERPLLLESRKTFMLNRSKNSDSVVAEEQLTTTNGFVFSADYGPWNGMSEIEITETVDGVTRTLSTNEYKVIPYSGKVVTQKRYALNKTFNIFISDTERMRVGFFIKNPSTTQSITIEGAGYVYTTNKERQPALSQVAPTASQIKISPNEPTINSVMAISYKYFDLNRNAESGTLIQWFKNGIPLFEINNKQSFSNTDLLPVNKLKSGDTISAIVTPSDGTSYGTAKNAPPVKIAESPPTLEAAKIVPTRNGVVNSVFDTSSVLTVSYQFLLPGSTSSKEKNTTLVWFVNGDIFKTQTFSFNDPVSKKTLYPVPTVIGKDTDGKDITQDDSAAFIIGNQIYVEITPKTSSKTGELIRTDTITLVNSVPVINDASIKQAAGNIDVSYTISDVDINRGSETDQTEIHWFEALSGGAFTERSDLLSKRSVPLSSFTKGSSVRVKFIPFDGMSFGIEFTTASILIT